MDTILIRLTMMRITMENHNGDGAYDDKKMQADHKDGFHGC